MYPTKRLTWEEEVAFSDALHAARELRRELGDEEPSTEEQRRTLEEGRVAADGLVTAHAGLAGSLASSVLRGIEGSPTIDIDDLIQIGLIAMYSATNSFDARRRGDGHVHSTGQRFSVYCTRLVRRDMYRALNRGEAILKDSIATATRTRQWYANKDLLEERLGRKPTPAEVSEFSGIPLDSIDMTLIGRHPVIGQSVSPHGGDGDDDDARLDVADSIDVSDVTEAMIADEYVAALDGLAREFLMPVEADALMLWLGTDRDIPRTHSEVAKELGIKVSHAAESVARGIAFLRHPQNVEAVREAALKAIKSIEEAPVKA